MAWYVMEDCPRIALPVSILNEALNWAPYSHFNSALLVGQSEVVEKIEKRAISIQVCMNEQVFYPRVSDLTGSLKV